MSDTEFYLFTDLARAADDIADEQTEALRRAHFRIVREAADGALHLRSVGDGAIASFASVPHAVDATVAIRRAVARHNRRAGTEELHVRVAVHAGSPIRDEEDLFGSSVVTARRLCEAAGGGHVLASAAVMEHGAQEALAGRVVLKEAGPFVLRAGAAPLHAFEVLWTPAGVMLELRPELAESDPPFVGRHKELESLERAWDRGRPHTSLLLVRGGPGFGKTRLLAEFVRTIDAAATTVLYGSAAGRSSTPFHAITDALGPFIAGIDERTRREHARAAGPSLAALFPGFDERSTTHAPSPESSDPAGATVALIEDLSVDAPVLLCLDDLEDADAATLEVLGRLASTPELPGVMVVGAYDGSRVVAGLPFSRFLRTPHGSPPTVSVAGLSSEELGALVAHRTTVSEQALRDVLDVAQGSPFVVDQCARYLAESGDEKVPEGALEAIGLRVSLRSEPCATVLAVAAREGFDESALARSLGTSHDDVATALEEAVGAGLLRRCGSTHAFRHALVREAVLSAAVPTDHIVIAVERPAAGQDPPAPAAPRGRSTGRDPMARVLKHVLRFPDELEPGRARADLAAVRPDETHVQAPVAGVLESMLAAATGSLGEESAVASGAAGSIAGWRHFAEGRVTRGFELMDDGLSSAEGIGDDLATFVATRAGASARLALLQPLAARGVLLKELVRRRKTGPELEQRLIADQLAVADALSGRLDEARSLAGEAGLGESASAAALIAACDGRWHDAHHLWERYAPTGSCTRPLAWTQVCLQARILRMQGEPERAGRLLESSLAGAASCGLVAADLWLRTELTILAAETGDTAAARPHRLRYLQIHAAGEDWRGLSGRIDLAEAACEAATGHSEEAFRVFGQAIVVFERYGLPWDRAEALAMHGRALLRAGRSEGSCKLEEAAETYRTIRAGSAWLEMLRARD